MSKIKENVKKSYGSAVTRRMQQETSCCGPVEVESECCPSETGTTGVTEKISETTPSFGCVVGLSQKAQIRQGDIVVDLGSGAGYDVFEAAKLVGPDGQVVGVDFTPEMLTTARNLATERGITNVDFRMGDIENIEAVPDDFADVVISNCVINLTVAKSSVFKEAYRILKPGGRLVDADIIAVDELPAKFTNNPGAWCSCLGGALTESGYRTKIEEAGFSNIKVTTYGQFTNMGQEFQNGLIEATKNP
ncbi:MAG: methyltransferase domain-containing protein [Candidatus Heimdallarchaeota archaeon]